MFLPSERHHLVAYLESHAPEIIEEMSAISVERFVPIEERVVASGRWRGFGLLDRIDLERGVGFDANGRSCPRTRAAVERIPGILVAAFVRMGPRTRLHAHTDDQLPRFLRFHLALTPGEDAWLRVCEERIHWEAGHCRGFDPQQLHCAANEGERPRVLLCVDVRYEDVALPLLDSTS